MYFVKETEGVCVVTYGQSRDFPAFFSPKSGCQAPYNINQPEDAANMIGNTHTLIKQKQKNHFIFLVPIFHEVK